MSWQLKRTAALVWILAAFGLLLGPSAASAAEEFDKYKLESVSAELSSTQAGAHADFTMSFALSENAAENRPWGMTRDVIVHLPPGLIGNPQPFPRCTLAQLGELPEESECPQDSQVGLAEVTVAGEVDGTLQEPIYNMVPPGGDVVARLGFFGGFYPALVNVRVDPSDYSLIASLESAPAAAELISARTKLWGVPAASAHDEERLTPNEAAHPELPPGGRPSGQPEVPFMSNPTDCSLAREISVTARSYQVPDAPSTMSAPFPQISGCQKLDFKPTFTATPTNPEAFAPTGLDATVRIPQNEAPLGNATSTLRSATVTLPPGFTINPAAGDGLAACSAAEIGFGTNKPSACPAASKIGSAEFEVPALERTLKGAVYQRTPEPGRLLRFWLATDEQGVHLKLPAEIEANPLTGQITTRFDGIASLGGNPQVPVAAIRLHIFGGPRAPLATPGCGSYATHWEFTPWSGRSAAVGDAPMQITSGCGKGGFSPGLQAGTVDPAAGRFAPFAMTLTRSDGEGNPQLLAVHLPKGLIAKFAGVPLCSDNDAAIGSCDPSTEIGHLAVAAGVGGAPLWIPQPGKSPTAIYLAGPYKGAPYSIVAKVPAQAGPFDLGTVLTRAGIFVDPESATGTVKTDPLPQILEGIPIAYRAVYVKIDRRGFTLNPTSCKAKQITATVTAADGQVSEAAAGYQATECAKLAYRPELTLAFKGSTRRTGNPGITAVLKQKPHEANTGTASVILPASEMIDNAHINNPCTRDQFKAEKCPKSSILGRATATTPLFDQPLRGPVYFRSNGGARELPDIVADLRGPIHVTLVGYIDSVKVGKETSRVRTRFLHVPDAPVTKFTMSLFGGKRGLIENSRNICLTGRRAKIRLQAQNGRVRTTNAPMKASCGRRR